MVGFVLLGRPSVLDMIISWVARIQKSFSTESSRIQIFFRLSGEPLTANIYFKLGLSRPSRPHGEHIGNETKHITSLKHIMRTIIPNEGIEC